MNIMRKANKPIQQTGCDVFDLKHFLSKDEVFHIARVCINTRNDISYHSHNYAELFWVEKGIGIHYINGDKIRIQADDIVFIRPEDRHTFSSSSKNGLTLVNIAFPANTLEIYRNRYFPTSNRYFWSKSILPFHITVSDKLIKRFSSRAEETMRFKRSYMQLDSLLLFILRNIQPLATEQDYSNIPSWLISAIKNYNNTDCFRNGTSGFVELCDRNSDYVNRVIKEVFHQTMTEFVNDIRIKHAADQLILTSIPIKQIAYSCGFESLAHFYKRFRIRYEQTPLEYRKLNQKII